MDIKCHCDNAVYVYLWLDIVVLVDNSQTMTIDGLDLVDANVADTFSQLQIVDADDPHTSRGSRIGVVTYNKEATVEADLNKFQTEDDLYSNLTVILSTVANTDQSYLSLGLSKAEQVLTAGRSNGTRANCKQVIIVYAASVQGNALEIANNLKSKDIKIITIDMSFGDKSVGAKLAQIGSNGMSFAYDPNVRQNLMSACCRANCFCPDGWIGYQPANPEIYSSCIQVFAIPTFWSTASSACQQFQDESHLIDELTNDKHNFVQQLFQNTTGNTSNYHIGLYFRFGQWVWDQGAFGPKPLTDEDQQTILWSPDFPSSASVNTGVANMMGSNGKVGWQNINPYKDSYAYVCQISPCSTETYCK